MFFFGVFRVVSVPASRTIDDVFLIAAAGRATPLPKSNQRGQTSRYIVYVSPKPTMIQSVMVGWDAQTGGLGERPRRA